jgi:hypothetical protein
MLEGALASPPRGGAAGDAAAPAGGEGAFCDCSAEDGRLEPRRFAERLSVCGTRAKPQQAARAFTCSARSVDAASSEGARSCSCERS